MNFETKTVRRIINKAFLKEPIERGSFTVFKDALEQFHSNVEIAKEKNEHEEHFKNFLAPFFNEVGFQDYSINTSGRIDMAIHTGGKGKDPVGVLIEAKRPGNSNEMITKDQINRKAMHEAVLYYLEQRIEQDNSDLKHVIITNMDEWFIFDAQEFERFFYRPSTLRKTWKEWKSDRKVSSNNDFMYTEISRYIDSQDSTITGLWLPLNKTKKFLKGEKDSEYEKKLIPIYKLFTPTQLLKEPFANDSNSLNKEFYRELLYILGLEETKQGSTRYIQRAPEESRNQGAIIENTIRILDVEDHLSTLKNSRSSYGKNREEQLFSVAMELSITWMNRILFLKLLEAQLYRYHRQDKNFKFLNFKTIDGLDELNKLFFQVLARKEKDRSDDINEVFGHIPYLNSSLFDVSSLERQTTRISGLDDHANMPVYGRSVLAKKRGKSLNTLDYLFQFLEAYDFSAEGSEEIRDESKSLVNASVLGLIFEKINGYKDGSFYTPGFITEYMARETLRKAVVDKFAKVFSALSPTPLPRGEVRRGEGKTRGMSASEPWKKIPESLLENARHLRKNQTDAEELLWKLLRKKQLNGFKFRRQHPIEEGFILDFYCHEVRLAVELDGKYHEKEDRQLADTEREKLLEDMGIRVVRFKNEVVLNDTEQVLKALAAELDVYSALTFKDIYNRIGRDISIERANDLINSITVCDPAVGSGHFLVSCLNELIAIKSELGILCDDEGKVLRGVEVTVENDELIISWGDEELFEYDVSHSRKGTKLSSRSVSSDLERVQKTLFKEKRYLIENCLFGVDINPNSVKICRLRLWIELLKRAYYTPESSYMELEVLPNIDINIKQGNSLVSRFELDSDLRSVFKDSEHSLEDYKEAVRSYKHTGDRSEKQRLQQLIDDIKKEYTTTLTNYRPINQKISRARGKLQVMQNDDLFGDVKFTKKEIKKQEKKLKKLEEQKAEEESGAFYNQAFEWRFEFPEVLDDDGRFTGFDVVIGNPPYGRYNMFTNEERAYLKDRGCYGSTGDIAEVFINFVIDDLSNENTQLSFIVPKGLSYVKSWGSLREKMLNHARIFSIIDTSRAFDEALYEMLIFHIDKNENQSEKIRTGYLSNTKKELFYVPSTRYSKEIFYLGFPEEYFPILEKINDNSTYLSNHYEFWYGKGGMTPKVNKEGKGIKVLTGKEIQRYFFKGIKKKWYLEESEINEDDLIRSKKTKVVAQDIVAHIQNPKPHLKLTATIDEDKQFCLNTVMCFSEKEEKELSNQFLTGLINSKLMSFYFYYFIFNQAIRTMHFMPGYADRLPIHNNSKLFHNDISEKVNEVLKVKNQNPEADTTELEAEIDRLLYELYGLNEEEIRIVEGETIG